MLEKLKQSVYEANLALPKNNLVTLTWGNVSGVDREEGVMAIKPSGVSYEEMKPEDMVIVRLSDGEVIDSRYKPSSDTPTHLVLYRSFPEIGGVCHTHSRFATIFAQAGREIEPLGTTHADYFHGSIPLTRFLNKKEIENDYEANTGYVIAEEFKKRKYNHCPAVLVRNHGPFTWGESAAKAMENAVVLEEVAFMAYHTLQFRPVMGLAADQTLFDKHFFRKHGKNAYYGQ
jgi:L-ribulose-5-phosphate 4-epimerase